MTGQTDRRRLWPLIVFTLTAVICVPAVIALVDMRGRNRDDLGVLTRELPEMLADFELAIGYSGFIHDFKNAVLRGGEPKYAAEARDGYDQAMRTLARLDVIARDVGLDIDMSAIRDTLNAYRRALLVVEHGHRQGWSAEQIDDAVRIPDAAAILNLVSAHEVIQAALLDRTELRRKDMNVLFGLVWMLLVLLPGSVIVLMWLSMTQQARRLAEIQALNKGLDDSNGRLRLTNSQLHSSNQKLDEFAHVAAHDLQAPVRGIANHINFMVEDHGPDMPPALQRRMQRVHDLCGQIETLISTLLAYSRIDRAARMEQVDLTQIVADIRSSLSDQLAACNGAIVIDADLPPVRANPADATTILRNLILNGLAYTRAARPVVHVGYQPKVDVGGETLEGAIYVKDNGIGIAPEFHDAIFRMFKRLNRPEDFTPGSGAGLAFVRRLVETQGGRVTVASEPGRGSIFYVVFGPGQAQDAQIIEPERTRRYA